MLTETLEAPRQYFHLCIANPLNSVALAKKNQPKFHTRQCAGQEKDGKYIFGSSPIVNLALRQSVRQLYTEPDPVDEEFFERGYDDDYTALEARFELVFLSVYCAKPAEFGSVAKTNL